jgi:hypothetical protein
MFRYLLLLILCVPLLWKAYKESEALALSLFSGHGPSDQALTSLEEKFKTDIDAVSARYAVRDSVLLCVIGVGEECPVVANGSQAEGELTPKLKDYAAKLKDIRTFFIRWGDKTPDPSWQNPCDNRDLKKLLEQRQDFLKLRAEAEKAYARYLQGSGDRKALLDDLEKAIDKLKDHPGRNPGSDKKLRAEIGLRELKQSVAGMTEEVAKANLEKKEVRASLLKRIAEAIQHCDEFSQSFPDVPEMTSWADKERTNWKRYKTLLELIDQNDSHQSGNEFMNHLTNYNDLLKDRDASTDFVKQARQSAFQFCGLFLSREKLDDRVLLTDKNDLYERRLVRIHWKKGPATPLEDPNRPDQNEFTLEKNDVEFFSVGDKDLPWPIHPTERSKTARKFNELRDKLTWNETALMRLRDDYKKMKEPLPLTVSHLDTLIDAATKFPKLFGTSD